MNEKHPAPQERGTPETESTERPPHRHPRILLGLTSETARHEPSRWVDAAVPGEELERHVRDLLSRHVGSAAAGVAICGSSDFADYTPDPSEDLATVAMVARGIQEHGDAFAFWAHFHDADPQMLAAFEKAYLGEWDSPAAWVEAQFERLGAATHGDPSGDWTYGEIAQQLWIEGHLVIAHTDHGTAWLFQNVENGTTELPGSTAPDQPKGGDR